MQMLHPNLIASLQAARDGGIAPAYFFWVRAKDRATGALVDMGLWSGDEDLAVSVESPTGGLISRVYLGGCNLEIDGIPYVADLTDNSVMVGMSQIADATQALVRGTDVRLAYCEIHSTAMNGGAFASPPQLKWVGIVDEGPINTPALGDEGGIALTIRSELMAQLTSMNPAKSSDSHQKRRRAGDQFSKYSGSIKARNVQWYQQ